MTAPIVTSEVPDWEIVLRTRAAFESRCGALAVLQTSAGGRFRVCRNALERKRFLVFPENAAQGVGDFAQRDKSLDGRENCRH
jgi:hypothetical protein